MSAGVYLHLLIADTMPASSQIRHIPYAQDSPFYCGSIGCGCSLHRDLWALRKTLVHGTLVIAMLDSRVRLA